LIDWYLPGTKAGGPVRSVFSLLSLLKDRFQFYLITTNTDLGSNQPYKAVPADTLFEEGGVHYYYFSSPNLKMQTLLKVIEQISPDLIYLNSFWSYFFSIGIVRAKNRKQVKAPLLIAPRGMLGKGALSLKPFKKSVYLRFSKWFKLYRKHTFHATNEQEKKDIQKRFKKAKVLLAPNLNAGSVHASPRSKVKNQLKLFYLSRIARVKNLHFALEVLAALPEDVLVTYDIFGNIEDNDYWKVCSNLINQLPKNIKVNYKGELAFNEVQGEIVKYHAMLLPTLNENFGHSIVESLLCGCPVITSDQTPWNDLAEWDAGYALSLDQKPEFVRAISELASLDADQLQIKSMHAINYISGKMNLKQNMEQYNSLFNGAIKNRLI
jgi:glycosyltransferase involved in cell wall biosynthesis